LALPGSAGGGSLQYSPDSIDGFKGQGTSGKKVGKKREKRGGKGREKKGRGIKGGEGRKNCGRGSMSAVLFSHFKPWYSSKSDATVFAG